MVYKIILPELVVNTLSTWPGTDPGGGGGGGGV